MLKRNFDRKSELFSFCPCCRCCCCASGRPSHSFGCGRLCVKTEGSRRITVVWLNLPGPSLFPLWREHLSFFAAAAAIQRQRCKFMRRVCSKRLFDSAIRAFLVKQEMCFSFFVEHIVGVVNLPCFNQQSIKIGALVPDAPRDGCRKDAPLPVRAYFLQPFEK